MAPKLYDMGDYALYLCEDKGCPFITYQRTYLKAGESDYIYELSSSLDHPPNYHMNGVKIELSGINNGVVVLQNQFGGIHRHVLSEESHSVIKEAVKILIDHIIRRDLLEDNT